MYLLVNNLFFETSFHSQGVRAVQGVNMYFMIKLTGRSNMKRCRAESEELNGRPSPRAAWPSILSAFVSLYYPPTYTHNLQM